MRTAIQIVGAVIGAIVYVIGIMFNLQGLVAMIAGIVITPPIFYWIGFTIFGGFMWWIIYSKQSYINKLESGRPQFTLDDKSGATVHIDTQKSKAIVSLRIYFKNIGSKPAHEFRMRVGVAPDGAPEQFKPFDERTSANRIDPESNLGYGYTYELTQTYTEKDSKKIVAQPGILIYCRLDYSDTPPSKESYNEEWWLSCRFDRAGLAALSLERKGELEPYVKLAYPQKAST